MSVKPPGVEGPVGKTGPTGPVGPVGPVGLPGPRGPLGLRGPSGPIGPTGLKGDSGGPRGPKGDDGAAGVAGAAGAAGPKGDDGAAGVAGAAGAAGPKGDTGATGPAGSGQSGTITDATIYVSHGSRASDNNDGLSPGSAVTTIAKAITLLAGLPGCIQLLASGNNSFAAPASGLVLVASQELRGVGSNNASVIDGSTVTSGTAVLTLTGSRSAARDLHVTNVPAGKTGVRITWIYGIPSNENSRLDNIFVDSIGANGTAFGIGDDTDHDVSEVCLTACCSVGNGSTSVHMVVGNGATGNVLDISNLGGNAQAHQYGLIVNGGAIVSLGMNFQANSVDIWLKQPGVGNTSIRGGRSESASKFVLCDFGLQGYASAVVADYVAIAIKNTDGRGVDVGPAPIVFDNVTLAGSFCPQFFYQRLRADGEFVGHLDARSCTSDHPNPFTSPYSRAGRIVRSHGTRFIADAQFEVSVRRGTERWIRRINPTSSAYSFNPAWSNGADIQLALSPGAFTLAPGDAVGQRFSICFVQDGVGGWSYAWPSLCVFSGGSAPANVTTPRNRQRVEFEWNGRYWEQCGPIVSLLPPTLAANPIVETFAGGSQYNLGIPASGGPWPWEPFPGGGSLGSAAGVCRTNSLGWVGDGGPSDSGLFSIAGAVAVIETGIALSSVSATFVWQQYEGIITHALDDQNFVLVYLASTQIGIEGYNCGVSTSFGTHSTGVTLVPGTTHTLLVQWTATNFVVSVDGAVVWNVPLGSFAAKFGDLTKHGLYSSSRSATFSAFSVATP